MGPRITVKRASSSSFVAAISFAISLLASPASTQAEDTDPDDAHTVDSEGDGLFDFEEDVNQNGVRDPTPISSDGCRRSIGKSTLTSSGKPVSASATSMDATAATRLFAEF